MVSSRALLLFSAALSFARVAVADLELLERAPYDAVGILNKGLSGQNDAQDEFFASFAPDSQAGEKNASEPLLKDRSLELVERQTCPSGYGYCSSFGKCCPMSTECCPYGYCIDPANTCCPGGACKAGWGCCGPKCYPKGGDCCSDNNYCEPGNICVRIVSQNNRIVCCTDLKCTAAVVSGTTSYVSVQATAAPTGITTAPPQSTFVQTATVGVYETWYWTVTWWYYSFWWTTYRPSTSSVTYTKIYSTTTFTTTATDEVQARSEFSELSRTLSFSVPAEAHTSLAYYVTARTSASATPSFTFNPGAFSTGDDDSSTSSSTSSSPSTSRSSVASSASSASTASATQSSGSGASASVRLEWVQWTLGACGIASGLLMVLL